MSPTTINPLLLPPPPPRGDDPRDAGVPEAAAAAVEHAMRRAHADVAPSAEQLAERQRLAQLRAQGAHLRAQNTSRIVGEFARGVATGAPVGLALWLFFRLARHA